MPPTRHVFGPVCSRRLGRSLGIDLTPLKTCAFDCVYCNLGRTTHKTVQPAAEIDIDEVLDELSRTLARGDAPDFVTVSGSGEPTLHPRLDELLRRIRGLTRIPIALMTGGALLHERRVRDACALADLVLPTLAAHNDAQYQAVHRPADGLTFDTHLAGLLALRAEHAPLAVWLELFLVEGFNAADDDLDAFAELTRRIDPQRIQLNTTVRPPAELDARPVAPEKLHRWALALGPRAEVIAERASPLVVLTAANDAEILALCSRHPATVEQIAAGLRSSTESVTQHVERLAASGALARTRRGERVFYLSKDIAPSD